MAIAIDRSMTVDTWITTQLDTFNTELQLRNNEVFNGMYSIIIIFYCYCNHLMLEPKFILKCHSFIVGVSAGVGGCGHHCSSVSDPFSYRFTFLTCAAGLAGWNGPSYSWRICLFRPKKQAKRFLANADEPHALLPHRSSFYYLPWHRILSQHGRFQSH